MSPFEKTSTLTFSPTFEGVAGTENVRNWELFVNGAKVRYTLAFQDGKLVVQPLGLLQIIQ